MLDPQWVALLAPRGGRRPINQVAPAITGTEEVGSTLSVSDGTWTGSPTFAYQWFRAITSGGEIVTSGGLMTGNAISGETNNTYLLDALDEGEFIFCEVTATNANGSTMAQSNATGAIAGVSEADLTPPMTSNTAPAGYVASADQEAFGTAAWIAFDGNAAARAYPDVWHSDTRDMTVTPHHLQLQFPTAKTITRYILWKRSDVAADNPMSWTLKGSNDGSSWTTADTQTDVSNETYWEANDSYEVVSVASPIARTYWRIEITKVGRSGGSTSSFAYLSQLQLFGS